MIYTKIKCKNCGQIFVWSEEEKAGYAQRGLADPEHCPICRGIMEARSRDMNRAKYEGDK